MFKVERHVGTCVDTTTPITDARLQEALDYWLRKSAGKAMRRRADIDPIDIPKLLPDVMLVEVLPSGRYRLIGTENTDARGVRATGRYLDEVLPGPEYKAHVLGLYDECVQSRRALFRNACSSHPRPGLRSGISTLCSRRRRTTAQP